MVDFKQCAAGNLDSVIYGQSLQGIVTVSCRRKRNVSGRAYASGLFVGASEIFAKKNKTFCRRKKDNELRYTTAVYLFFNFLKGFVLILFFAVSHNIFNHRTLLNSNTKLPFKTYP